MDRSATGFVVRGTKRPPGLIASRRAAALRSVRFAGQPQERHQDCEGDPLELPDLRHSTSSSHRADFVLPRERPVVRVEITPLITCGLLGRGNVLAGALVLCLPPTGLSGSLHVFAFFRPTKVGMVVKLSKQSGRGEERLRRWPNYWPIIPWLCFNCTEFSSKARVMTLIGLAGYRLPQFAEALAPRIGLRA